MLQAFASGALFGEKYGEHTPWVLALPGWAHTHEDFIATLRGSAVEIGASTQSDVIDAIALDLPGFGATPAPEEPWGLAEYAEAVAPVLEEMAPRVVILGHSFGGRVALRLALTHPQQVDALVLSGVPFVTEEVARPTPRLGYRALRALWRTGVVSDDRFERIRQQHGSADYRAARGVMREVLVRILSESDDEALGAIHQPVELIWGAQDTASSPERARLAAVKLAAANLVVLPGIDHYTPTRSPEALRAGLLRHRS